KEKEKDNMGFTPSLIIFVLSFEASPQKREKKWQLIFNHCLINEGYAGESESYSGGALLAFSSI
ncbi:MAG: hypothetical protein ACTSSA_15675, partial [Candidatus Freyarchaeota archaeon]